MHYFEFATEDATLYEGEATQSVNTGMDEILEVRKDMNDTASVINVSRFLIKFDLTFISQSVVDGLIPSSANGAKYYLNLYDAGSEGLPRTHTLYAYPVSQSWSVGQGTFHDDPQTTEGCSWRFRTGETTADQWVSEVNSETLTFGTAEKYNKVVLSVPNVIEVISCTDSDGNTWYEVPFLAQDTVFDEIENSGANDSELVQFNDTAPYLLKLRKTPRRFTTFIRDDGRVEMRFGAGVSDNPDEEVVPNPDNVGSSLPGGVSKLDTAFDPSNFLKTRTYGLAPSNTTLTVRYATGGGVEDNVPPNDIRNLSEVTFDIDTEGLGLTGTTVQDTKDSVAVNNPDPATGGRDGESLQEIKNNAAAYFQAQNRAVTKEDYMVRALSLPQRFGNIAKVYIVQDEQLNQAEENVQDDTAAEQQTFGQQVDESSNVDVVKQQRTTEAGGGY